MGRPIVISSSSDDNDSSSNSDDIIESPKKKRQCSRNRRSSQIKPLQLSSKSNKSTIHREIQEPSSSSNNPSKLVSQSSHSLTWTEKHVPEHIDSVSVHPLKKKQVAEWFKSLQSSSTQHHRPRILICSGPAGVGKSTLVKQVAKTQGYGIRQWTDASSVGSMKSSAMEEFETFLNQSCLYPSLHLVSDSSDKTKLPSSSSYSQNHIVLIEEWPIVVDAWTDRWRRMWSRIATHSRWPVVIIHSDVGKRGKVTQEALARFFSAELMSEATAVIHFNPVAKGILKKCLQKAASAEGVSLNTLDVEDIVAGCGGDLRHAMNTLQFYFSIAARISSDEAPFKKNAKKRALPLKKSVVMPSRDSFFSDFHVLGKLLYGKGVSEDTKLFDDRILEDCSMDSSKVTSYLVTNSPEFYSSIAELSDALEQFSFSATVSSFRPGSTNNNRAGQSLPDRIKRSVLGRVILTTNSNPNASTFRPLTSPESFLIRQQIAENQQEIKNTLFVNRELDPGALTAAAAFHRSQSVLCLDLLPYAHRILGLCDKEKYFSNFDFKMVRYGGGIAALPRKVMPQKPVLLEEKDQVMDDIEEIDL